MTIDKSGGPGIGHIYVFWTSNFSVCSPGFFRVQLMEVEVMKIVLQSPMIPFGVRLLLDPGVSFMLVHQSDLIF